MEETKRAVETLRAFKDKVRLTWTGMDNADETESEEGADAPAEDSASSAAFSPYSESGAVGSAVGEGNDNNDSDGTVTEGEHRQER